MLSLALLVITFVPMLLEARRSRVNDRVLRARGAIEPPGDVYGAMQILYPACFVAMIVEAWWRESPVDGRFALGLTLFVAAKALKYWAIATLGERWSFRVLVLPGVPLVRSGPYRYLNHPNYLAVVGELLAVALMGQALVTGILVIVSFGTLIALRVRVEDRALAPKRLLDRPSSPSRASEGTGSGAL